MAKLRVPNSRRLGVDLAQSEKELVRQLVAFRKLRGLDIAEVARRMGVSRTTVYSFENLNSGASKTHTFLTAKRYAEAVDAYTAYMVFDAGSVKKDGDQATYATIKEKVSEHRKALEIDGAYEGNSAVQQKIADAVTCAHLETMTTWDVPERQSRRFTPSSDGHQWTSSSRSEFWTVSNQNQELQEA
ncbi:MULTISPECIES: helix-turn-helix domain-containing protein [Corynebacterium]|uniref:helix-turn-helix domain-containing protein n=1 Tax=Corynebacterium TaxID=1716 RepID=UPI0008A8DD51|nr:MULTISPECIES: helix-turn-helix transcriptional regulator [unclassified Corynebacterium]MBC6763213.1 XRE family transcriptional regulator [Corynebacterium sp. LK27]OHR30644.1 hypothetical protein HMPREF2847_06095 [Corynebacterium sp. HMSC074C03]